MRQFLAIFFVLTLSLAGCGGSEAPTENKTTSTTQNGTAGQSGNQGQSTPQQNETSSNKQSSGDKMANPHALIETSKGTIKVELNADKAPETVKNFIHYVEKGFYNDTVFHRVIPNFMVQGGGMNADMSEKKTEAPIQNEANNGLQNEVGTLAMARTNAPHSASSQFFINVADNAFLNHKNETPQGWGYAVFGKVVDGMDVVNEIVGVKTGNHGMHQDVPVEPVLMNKVTMVE